MEDAPDRDYINFDYWLFGLARCSFIIRTIVTVIGVILFCVVLGVCFPILREPLLFWWTTIWAAFKEFFLVDVLEKWLLYIVIATIITVLGFWISRKKEKKIWIVVSVIFDVISFIGFLNC